MKRLFRIISLALLLALILLPATSRVTLAQAAITQLSFITAAQTITAGEVSAVMTIQTEDASGNKVDVTQNTTLNLSSTSGTGRFDTDPAGPFDGSITSVTILITKTKADFYYKDTTAGTPTITAAEDPDQAWTDASQQQTVNPASLDHFTFNNITNQTAGIPFSITITAKDEFDNTATSYTGINSLSDTTGTISPTTTGAFTDGVWTGNVTITRAQTNVQITTIGNSISGTSDSFDVIAGAIAKLVFTTAAQTITGGEASEVMTIQTQDSLNNPTNAPLNITINLSSTSAQGKFSLSADPWVDITSVTISSGSNSASFYYKDTTVGTPTITASESPDQGWTDATQQQTVNPASGNKLVITTFPSSVTAGSWTSVYTVQRRDEYGNPVTSGTTIVDLASTSAGSNNKFSETSGGSAVTYVIIPDGSSSKNFYYYDELAGNWTISASATGLTGDSKPLTVNPGALDHFTFNTISNQTAGIPFSITITAKDEFDNTATSYTGINSLSDTTGTISPTTTGAFTDSVWTGNVTITTAQTNVQITTIGNSLSGTSNSFDVIAGAIAKLVFTTAAQTITGGEASEVMIIQTQDSLNNPANAPLNITVNLSSTSAQGKFSLSADPWVDITLVTIPSGSNSANFHYKDTTAGTPTITASESPDQSWTDATQQQTVNPASLHHFTFNTISNQTAGIPFPITITAKDEFDNTATTSYTGTNSLSDTTGTISPTTTGAFTDGVWTGNVTITKAQTDVQITTTGDSISKTSNSFDVIAGVIAQLAFTTAAQTITGGEASEIMTIQTQDASGNKVDVTEDITINLSSTSAQGKFSLSTDPWVDITSVTISSGSNSANFYYKDTTAGTPTITTSEDPDQGWTDATQTATITASPPTVTTDNATGITTNSAILNGNLTSLSTADNVTVSFQWGTTADYGNETTPQEVTETGTFTAALSELDPNTTYYFRAKTVGDGTSYGDDKSFTTRSTGGGGGGGGGAPASPPSVLTVDTLDGIATMRIKSDGTLLKSHVIADPSGNVFLWLDSGTKIICSDNQMPERLEVSLSEEPPPMPEGFAAVSPVYDLTVYISGGVPRPVTFDPPARLQINYSPEELPENVLSVFIAYHDEEEGWTQLEPPSGFVAAVGTAGAQVSHFTPFAVMAELAPPPSPARFELRNLDINPNQVTAGESVTISAQLVNIGGLSGEYTLMVNIEGLLETSQVIELAPGQSQEVSFSVIPASPGSYRVEIGGLRGSFVVRAIPTPAPAVIPTPAPAVEAGEYGWLIAIMLAVAAVAALVAALAFTTARKRLQRATVVEKPSKLVPGAFRVSNLNITPKRVKPGEDVTVIVEATNTGPVRSSYSLVLKVTGLVEAVKEVTLGPGQSEKVAFAILRDKPGIHYIDLENLKGSFTVAG